MPYVRTLSKPTLHDMVIVHDDDVRLPMKDSPLSVQYSLLSLDAQKYNAIASVETKQAYRRLLGPVIDGFSVVTGRKIVSDPKSFWGGETQWLSTQYPKLSFPTILRSDEPVAPTFAQLGACERPSERIETETGVLQQEVELKPSMYYGVESTWLVDQARADRANGVRGVPKSDHGDIQSQLLILEEHLEDRLRDTEDVFLGLRAEWQPPAESQQSDERPTIYPGPAGPGYFKRILKQQIGFYRWPSSLETTIDQSATPGNKAVTAPHVESTSYKGIPLTGIIMKRYRHELIYDKTSVATGIFRPVLPSLTEAVRAIPPESEAAGDNRLAKIDGAPVGFL